MRKPSYKRLAYWSAILYEYFGQPQIGYNAFAVAFNFWEDCRKELGDEWAGKIMNEVEQRYWDEQTNNNKGEK